MFLISCQNQSSTTVKTKPTSMTKIECNKQLLAMDDSLGSIRNHACEKISLSKTIKIYVTDLKAVPVENCSKALVSAFYTHLEAWENVIPITNKYDAMRGEMHDLFDEIRMKSDSTVFNTRVKAIWDTWADVEKEIEE